MSTRFTNAVLPKNNILSGTSSTLALDFGGQNAFLPRIGLVGGDGKTYGEWISNHAYIKRNIIPIVLQTPRFFDFMPEPWKWRRFFKSLIEAHALTIDGFSSGLTVETDEHAVGGGGEFQQEVTDVKRNRSTPSFTFQEKAGRAIQKFLEAYIKYGIMDPDTKTPNVVRYISNTDQLGGMYTPDFYTSTMIFIEPDITKMQVIDAWLCTNMLPLSAGERTGKMDKRSAAELLEHSIEFTAITLNTDQVLRLADVILGNLSVLKQIPDIDLVLPIQNISSEDNTNGAKGTSTGFNRPNGVEMGNPMKTTPKVG